MKVIILFLLNLGFVLSANAGVEFLDCKVNDTKMTVLTGGHQSNRYTATVGEFKVDLHQVGDWNYGPFSFHYSILNQKSGQLFLAYGGISRWPGKSPHETHIIVTGPSISQTERETLRTRCEVTISTNSNKSQ